MEQLETIRVEELRTVLPMLPSSARILDFGAGPGFQAVRLQEQGFDVSAIDLGCPQPLRRVFPVVTYDGNNLPYADRSFDVVFSSNVLEHVERLDVTMAELVRVLRSRGIMIHVLPSASWRCWTSLAECAAVPAKVVRALTLPVHQLRFGHILPRWLAAFAEALGQIVRPLLFLPHGEVGNAVTEIHRFSRLAWKKTFDGLNLEVRSIEPIKLFYTGENLLGPRLSIETRRRLARYLGSSTFVWCLAPRSQTGSIGSQCAG
jgi:SAM-dependent methyltransferase